jgi:uncharacterized protein
MPHTIRPMGTPPGWYPDPNAPGGQRWWDGSDWTQHTGGQIQPQPSGPGPGQHPVPRPDSTGWAVAAHLSALIGLFIGFSFIGPLVVYLVKRDEDPFVRDQAAEALNFNLSAFIYAIVGGIVLVIGILLIIGIVLIPVAIAAAIAWLVLVIVAAVRAGRGEAYRYPLTIRFVS